MEFRFLAPLTRFSFSCVFLCLSSAAAAAPGDEQFILQQQRQQALEAQLTPPAPDVRLPSPAKTDDSGEFAAETPCFTIRDVTLTGQDALPHWVPLQRMANQAVGKCLGAKGINRVMSLLQNRLISHGWTTARVLAPAQDLKSGHLALAVIPGKIRHVRLTDDSSRWLWLYSAFPAHDGNLLDLRDIEQGLENLQRLPTVKVEMDIVPAERPGESDIVITRQQSKFWRLGLSLDDSGTSSTGRYQGGMTLSLDNPLALSDLFWFSINHDLQTGPEKGNQNLSAHWSVPVGWWAFSFTGSDYHYHQTVAALTATFATAVKARAWWRRPAGCCTAAARRKPPSPGT